MFFKKKSNYHIKIFKIALPSSKTAEYKNENTFHFTQVDPAGHKTSPTYFTVKSSPSVCTLETSGSVGCSALASLTGDAVL